MRVVNGKQEIYLEWPRSYYILRGLIKGTAKSFDLKQVLTTIKSPRN